MKRNTHTIDAAGKSFGRLASEVAVLLRGKHKPEFLPNQDMGDKVVIENIDDMKVTGKKFEEKTYYHHTGYPGGIKERSMRSLSEQHGMGEVLKRAVWNMLPKNRLRTNMMKRLVIKK